MQFLLVGQKHQQIVLNWLKKEHVTEFFYGEGLKNTIRSLDFFVRGISSEKYPWKHWIAFTEGRPFGYLITSDITPEDKWFEEKVRAITLDILIGEEEFLGRGLAAQMVREFLSKKFKDASKVFIDPEISNKKAIHVYEKVGFKKIEQFTPDHCHKLHWMMCLESMKMSPCYRSRS